ncbi:Rrf2 family transcriptional regulator [Gemmatimonas aurantiaca]|nr:Rrf2 family transcriptional regulator [Gemmatimonas aurantiaca]
MSILLSKSSTYSLRATLYIAASGGEKYMPVRKIAEELHISFHFLAKILQTLTQNGILKAFRGPNGGVALAKPAREILISDIVNAFEGRKYFDQCIMGLPNCGEATPCPLHEKWLHTQIQIRDLFEGTTLQDQADRIREMDLRLN